MGIKLNYIGRTDHLVNFSCNSSIGELCDWFKAQDIVQFDTETNLADSIVSRVLKVLQFGNLDGTEVYVIQWSFLTDAEKLKILELLGDKTKLKIIHNASFDYQVMMKYGVIMENIWDTMVMEQCLYAGYDYDLRFFSLAAVLLRRFYIDVSKEQQSEFGDDIINDEKLMYAATDVVHLGKVYKAQRVDLIKEDLIQLGEGEYNENETVLAFADIEYYGMGFNPEKWVENIDKATPIVEEATNELLDILNKQPYLDLCHKLEVNCKLVDDEGKERKVLLKGILEEDTFTINWNSPPQLLKVLQYIFPDIEKASTLELKKYLQEKDPRALKTNEKGKPLSASSKYFMPYIEDGNKDWFLFIKLAILKKYDILEKAMLLNFKEKLVKDKLLLPKGTMTINWNSNPTKLEVFRWFNPDVENTDAETVEDNIHLPFFQAYKKYNNANSLLTKYGHKFIEKHVDPDGRVRTRFNTILSTGRVSSSSPKHNWAA